MTLMAVHGKNYGNTLRTAALIYNVSHSDAGK
jgi:hypothetical protein